MVFVAGISRLLTMIVLLYFFFFQAEDGIRDYKVTGVQTCALPIYIAHSSAEEPERPAEHGGARRPVGLGHIGPHGEAGHDQHAPGAAERARRREGGAGTEERRDPAPAGIERQNLVDEVVRWPGTGGQHASRRYHRSRSYSKIWYAVSGAAAPVPPKATASLSSSRRHAVSGSDHPHGSAPRFAIRRISSPAGVARVTVSTAASSATRVRFLLRAPSAGWPRRSASQRR